MHLSEEHSSGSPPPPPPCASLSKAAKDFVRQSSQAQWEAFHPENIAELRRENSEVGAAAWKAVQEKEWTQWAKDIRIEEGEVGGVKVQWVKMDDSSGKMNEGESQAGGKGSPDKENLGDLVILYLFGGGFIVGCPEDDLSMTSRIAHLMRPIPICVPRYRLAPEHPFPAARDDVRVVYESLIGGDRRNKVMVIGESAGGNLALGLTLDILEKNDREGGCHHNSKGRGAQENGENKTEKNKEENIPIKSAKISSAVKNMSPPPVALALFSPWIDLTHSGDSHVLNANLDPTLSVSHFLEPCAKLYTSGGGTESYDKVAKQGNLNDSSGCNNISSPQISPLFSSYFLCRRDDDDNEDDDTFGGFDLFFPPVVISTSTRDLLLSDSTRLANTLRSMRGRRRKKKKKDERDMELDLDVELRVNEGLWHVFEWYPQCPEAVESIQEMCSFLLKYC